jgi:acyl-CoA thioesterase YciA
MVTYFLQRYHFYHESLIIKITSLKKDDSVQIQDNPTGKLVIQIVAMPADTNANGDIFGGWLVSKMDMGAGIAARQYANCRVVTVAIDSLVFIRPVNVGDIVCCYADLIKVGNTSMRFKMEVWTISIDGIPKKSAEGIFTFVATNNEGRPQPVNPALR